MSCSDLCRICFKKQAMVCPECMLEEIKKETDRLHEVLNKIQETHIPGFQK